MAGARNIYFSGYELVRGAAPLGSLLPAGSELQRIYEDTSRRAMTVRDLLEMLATFERSMTGTARRVQQAAARGLLVQEDARLYDVLADALFGVEMYSYNFLQRLLPDTVARQLPRPIRLPTAAQLAGVPSRSRLPSRTGLAGLGAVPAVVWAAAVLALLVAVAAGSLVYAFTSGDVAAEEARQAIAIADVTQREWESMLAARERAYDSCVAQGGTPEDCAESARRLVPTPEEAGVVPQLITPSARGVWGFVLPALLLVSVVGGVGYFFTRARRSRSASSSSFDDDFGFDGLSGARRVKRLDGPSSYYLEVKGHGR